MGSFKGGYTGRLLRVDPTEGRITTEKVPDVEQWLGPRGWNAWIGWKETGPGVGPFDPENRIVFSAGPLVGTGAPTAGRMTISTIAPRNYPTPMWVSASIGGYIGAELKYAGYDGVVVFGRANAPCYLLIEDDRVSLRDASGLWGQGVYHTEQHLKERHSQAHQIMTSFSAHRFRGHPSVAPVVMLHIFTTRATTSALDKAKDTIAKLTKRLETVDKLEARITKLEKKT